MGQYLDLQGWDLHTDRSKYAFICRSKHMKWLIFGVQITNMFSFRGAISWTLHAVRFLISTPVPSVYLTIIEIKLKLKLERHYRIHPHLSCVCSWRQWWGSRSWWPSWFLWSPPHAPSGQCRSKPRSCLPQNCVLSCHAETNTRRTCVWHQEQSPASTETLTSTMHSKSQVDMKYKSVLTVYLTSITKCSGF